MQLSAPDNGVRDLRVLLVANPSGGSLALAGWLQHLGGLSISGPQAAGTALGGHATGYSPHVVVLDVDGLAVSLSQCIAQLQVLSPRPVTIAVACDASTALRRHCAAAGVHAVFAKTTELDQLAAMLATLGSPSAAVTSLAAP